MRSDLTNEKTRRFNFKIVLGAHVDISIPRVTQGYLAKL